VRTLRLAPLLVATALALPLTPLFGSLAAQPAEQRPERTLPDERPLVVTVLSNRADLISGGDALVRVRLPQRVRPRTVEVFVGRRDVTERFRMRSNGTFEGLVDGLRIGRNVIRATAPGHVGRTVVTNHPNGGPVFTGPQLRPYQCQKTAVDRKCNEPATYSLLYKREGEPGLHPYDKGNPPEDVATTTTDEGVEVPFIVRQEEGFQDRDRYTILQLWQPGKKWAPWRAQEQWNHKVVVTHGGGCGASYAPGGPPLDDYSGTLPEDVPLYEQSYVAALGKGFAVLSTALDNTGHNCNLAMQAESLVMAKERLVEQYGPIRYTIGTGCSGGSIAQHTVANAYPGIYQGLVTTCSYPDVLTAGAQFADYHLLRLYFEDPSRWGMPWSPTQMAAVEGHASHVNAVTADEGLFKSALNPEHDCSGTEPPLAGDESTRYDSDINPGGVRCSVLDIMVNLLGRRPEATWSEWEQAAGQGFAGLPFSNAGVQYGLEALRSGDITPAQFVDLNEKVGGLDINADFVTERIEGDDEAIENAYGTGLINQANHLDEVAIINHGGPDPGAAHDYSHAWWTEERLLADQGHTDNRVMWFGTTPLIGNLDWAKEALFEMDRWLTAVEADRRKVPLSRKVVEDKPGDITDRCEVAPNIDVEGIPGAQDACHRPEFQTHYGTPRQVAGGPSANDNVACRLQPLDRGSYTLKVAEQETPVPIPFTDDEWARMQAVFPQGVCDWSEPARGEQRAETWLVYSNPDGTVAYGGRPLPGVPAHSGTGWSSGPFRSLLEQ
jgi:hypothetical protein